MKHHLLGIILCIFILCIVHVRSRKQKDKKEPVFSVPDISLALCAATCYKHSRCMYFVYTGADRRCDGYVEYKDCEDDMTAGERASGLGYRHKCIKRCEAGKPKAAYKIKIKTGKKGKAGSTADLRLTIGGTCGKVRRDLKNGKDINLRKGHRSSVKFVDDSVCIVNDVGLAFVEPCHSDDWFVENILVVTKEKESGIAGSWRFRTEYWLNAHSNGKQTTGIICIYKPMDIFLSRILSVKSTDCSRCQICEWSLMIGK